MNHFHLMLKILSLFIYLFLFFNTSIIIAQKPKVTEMEFDSLYVYISTNLASRNNDSAFVAAKSLLSKVDNPLHNLKVMMLLATLYERKGDAINAINYANQAYHISKNSDNKEWLLRINGFMSTAYRKVDLTQYGRKHLDEAIVLSKELKKPLFQAFILQEKAIYSMNEKKYKQALHDLNESILILETSDQKLNLNAFFWATNAQLLGLCYKNMGRLDEAKHQYESALDSLNNIESELKGFCYWGLASISVKQGELEKTAALIDKAQKYTESSKNFELQLNMAELYIEYYTIQGDSAKVLQHQREVISIKEKQKIFTRDIVNKIIDKADNEIALTKVQNRQSIFISISVAMTILLAFLFFNAVRIRKQKKTYELIISKIQKDKQFLINEQFRNNFNTNISTPESQQLSGYDEHHIEVLDPNDLSANNKSTDQLSGEIDDKYGEEVQGTDEETVIAKNEDVQNWKKNIISEEYKKLLKEKLTAFEEGNSYLKPNLTLTNVASELNTNTKYLSVYISEYKASDFNDYINRLKISYIIEKLHSDPAYREYKISYLAEESGFSSHAKFATVFKEIVGISPSIFIKNLQSN